MKSLPEIIIIDDNGRRVEINKKHFNSWIVEGRQDSVFTETDLGDWGIAPRVISLERR